MLEHTATANFTEASGLPRGRARAWSSRRGSALHTGGRWTVALEREDLITLIGRVTSKIIPFSRLLHMRASLK